MFVFIKVKKKKSNKWPWTSIWELLELNKLHTLPVISCSALVRIATDLTHTVTEFVTYRYGRLNVHPWDNTSDSDCSLQYVGSLDVPRPNSRMEIVAAMRRIRVRWNLYVTSVKRPESHTPPWWRAEMCLYDSTVITHTNTKSVQLSDEICMEDVVTHALAGPLGKGCRDQVCRN